MTACIFCGADPEAKVLARWEFFLPMDAPSQNTIAANNRHSRDYRAIRDDFELLVMAEKRRQGIPEATGRRRIVLTRLFAGQRARARDKGNLIGGMKPLLDAFVRNKLLVDDRSEYCEDHYRQERHPRHAGVYVVLQELA